jgi:hypothetical protein
MCTPETVNFLRQCYTQNLPNYSNEPQNCSSSAHIINPAKLLNLAVLQEDPTVSCSFSKAPRQLHETRLKEEVFMLRKLRLFGPSACVVACLLLTPKTGATVKCKFCSEMTAYWFTINIFIINKVIKYSLTHFFMFCWPCSSIYACNETKLMHYLTSVYSITINLHVSDLLVAHRQEITVYICNNWYVLIRFRCLSAGLVVTY